MVSGVTPDSLCRGGVRFRAGGTDTCLRHAQPERPHMPWYFFAILGALLDAVYYALIKKSLKDVNQYVFGSGAFFTACILLLTISWLRGFPALDAQFWYAAIASSLLNAVAASFYFKALRLTDLSLALPMISFTPLFLILTSWFMLSEAPSWYGALGILLIVAGSYVLNFTSSKLPLLAPLQAIYRNKGALLMGGVALVYSVTTNLDKIIVVHSDPYFSSAIVFLFLGVLFAARAARAGRQARTRARQKIPAVLTAGLLSAGAAVAANIAFTSQIVPYVISLKRLAVVFSVILGALFFKEKNLLTRSLGASLMFTGVVIILLFQ
ncbi:MAG: hypothetical protein UY44_C0005G0002 [Candidatus Kaiserbacteria bacterium GW2011_GWA2_49_19]|uniref:EamA domain-containing protein n=1 Tax=Candidatus Kaiserbacteria bacterium GW2011_GWA2_49_19 TaxID=1618669 RepID=A0A0G1VS25_9BACT|nr:MAG: hypothetical protein UY44_C0005G0002 [Candidatus Kaiserbacteria bacterium GW2011_GWA2_49_19]